MWPIQRTNSAYSIPSSPMRRTSSSSSVSSENSLPSEQDVLLSPEQQRIMTGLDRFNGTVCSGAPVSRPWWQKLNPKEALQNLVASAQNALDDMAAARHMEGLLKNTHFPPAADIQAFYRDGARGVGTRHKVLSIMSAMELKVFCNALEELVRDQKFNSAVLATVRDWFDALLGPCQSVKEARYRCKRLFLTQHPDKVGERDFGSPVYNRNARALYHLLGVSKNALSSEPLATALYPPPSPGTALQALFFFVAAVLLLDGYSNWSGRHSSEPSVK